MEFDAYLLRAVYTTESLQARAKIANRLNYVKWQQSTTRSHLTPPVKLQVGPTLSPSWQLTEIIRSNDRLRLV